MQRNRFFLLLAAAVLAGCANPSPRLDASFGDTVRQVKTQQTLDPQAGGDPTLPTLDGASARHALERQRESFKTPPPTFQIFGIGGSGGGSGSK